MSVLNPIIFIIPWYKAAKIVMPMPKYTGLLSRQNKDIKIVIIRRM